MIYPSLMDHQLVISPFRSDYKKTHESFDIEFFFLWKANLGRKSIETLRCKKLLARGLL